MRERLRRVLSHTRMLELPESPSSTRRPQTRLRRYLKPAVLTLAVLGCVGYLVSTTQPTQTTHLTFESKALYSHSPPQSQDAFDFWNAFAAEIAKGKPSFEEIKYVKDSDPPWFAFKDLLGDEKRPDRLDMSRREVEEMKRAHQAAVSDFRALGPRLPFVKGTRGIVTTANMDAMAILTTALMMLRKVGSKLPVEVWLYNRAEYEESIYMCENVFKPLNAHCMIMLESLPEKMDYPYEVSNKFMFKLDAILFSTYEQILFLDCDLFPVTNPDSIFTNEPFVSTGAVLWPDHWALTSAPQLYEITGREQLNMTARASTESGAMLINKNTHAEALLLATFYNYWGPKHYYRLLSQGASGEGDKDTYLPAMEVYKLPFYQVAEPPQRIGYRCNGGTRAIASGQAHPHDDLLLTSNEIWRNQRDPFLTDTIPPRILFVHANLPKPDAAMILDWRPERLNWFDMLRCDDGKGKAHRMWGPKEITVIKYGWDVEKAIWDSMRWTACTHGHGITYWVNGTWHSKPRPNACRDILAFYDELLPDETYDPTIPSTRVPELPWGAKLHMQ